MIDLQDIMITEGLVGGILIGVAAAIMLLAAGRIAGISGLFANSIGLVPGSTNRNFAVMFTVSLLAGAWLAEALTNDVVTRYPDNITLIIGGVLVGFGTRLGSGCTSGHGVCGLSRLSKRSLYATPIFMISAIITVAVINAVGGVQ